MKIQLQRKLRVAIDCRIDNPHQGIGTAVMALVNALSSSSTKEQEYTVIARDGMSDWIKPYIYGPCRLLIAPQSKLKANLRLLRPLRSLWWKLLATGVVNPPSSNGFAESHNFDLVHFPTQEAYLTKLPSIYQPWDLQHLHHPEFFRETAIRDRFYRAFCRDATFISVQTNWGKQDLVDKFALAPEKVKVIRWGSVLDAYDPPSAQTVSATIERLGLPKQFFFYPAVTWPHKNHETIIRALGVLKLDHALKVDVYFTGMSTELKPHLEAIAKSVQVHPQIHFLGFLPADELQAVFSSATAMVFASKFEGFGLPILEAFHSRLPVLSSNASVLPEVAQDAALYFDPNSPTELAAKMKQILENENLRAELVLKGKRVLTGYSMKDTAAEFQALYEKTAVGFYNPPVPTHV